MLCGLVRQDHLFVDRATAWYSWWSLTFSAFHPSPTHHPLHRGALLRTPHKSKCSLLELHKIYSGGATLTCARSQGHSLPCLSSFRGMSRPSLLCRPSCGSNFVLASRKADSFGSIGRLCEFLLLVSESCRRWSRLRICGAGTSW